MLVSYDVCHVTHDHVNEVRLEHNHNHNLPVLLITTHVQCLRVDISIMVMCDASATVRCDGRR